MRPRSHQHELATSSVIVVDLSPAAAAAAAAAEAARSTSVSTEPHHRRSPLRVDFADKFVIDDFV